MIEAALYLIPVPLSDAAGDRSVPGGNVAIIRQIKHFIVENERSARRFLKACDREIDIDGLTFYPLNGHTPPEDVAAYLDPLKAGNPMGVLSEAGCPAVADPGAEVVAAAHRLRLRVIPLVGPSSVIMSLMASGMNGQSFAFHGYLPIDSAARSKKFRAMERAIAEGGQTQIFIEAPYRNDKLMAEMLATLPKGLRLCVATGITGPDESVVTRTVAEWNSRPTPIGKVPTIFLLCR